MKNIFTINPANIKQIWNAQRVHPSYRFEGGVLIDHGALLICFLSNYSEHVG